MVYLPALGGGVSEIREELVIVSGTDTRGIDDASTVRERDTNKRQPGPCNAMTNHPRWNTHPSAIGRGLRMAGTEAGRCLVWRCGLVAGHCRPTHAQACRSAILSGILLAGRLGCMW